MSKLVYIKGWYIALSKVTGSMLDDPNFIPAGACIFSFELPGYCVQNMGLFPWAWNVQVLGRSVPTFQGCLLPPSSGWMEASSTSGLSVKDSHRQSRPRENLKTCYHQFKLRNAMLCFINWHAAVNCDVIPVTQAPWRLSELLPVLNPDGGDGPQCSGSHGQGRVEEADREYEIPGNNGALATVKEHSRVSTLHVWLLLPCDSFY